MTIGLAPAAVGVTFAVVVALAIQVLCVREWRAGAARVLDAAVGAIARVAGRIISAVAMIIVIIPASFVLRLLGRSPLVMAPTPRPSAWAVTASAGSPGPRPGEESTEPDRSRQTRPRRRARVAVALALVALTVVALGRSDRLPWSDDDQRAAGRDTFTLEFEDDPAFEDAPWARNVRLTLLEAWRNLEFNAAIGGWQLRDTRSEFVNIEDGVRRTSPPAADLGPPATVWLFGGSAAFGAGQRDEHTIASELVHRFGQQGIPVEVRNLAVPATVNWQSALLMIERLQWDDPPDLIVVYDGANDVALQDTLTGRGRGQSDRPASLVDGQLDEILREQAEEAGAADDLVGGVVPRAEDDPPSPTEAAELISFRYGQGLELMRRSAAAFDVPIRFFWQPDLRMKRPLSSADRETLARVGIDDASVDRTRVIVEAIRERLDGLGVTDLSSVFDGESEPIYWDTVHTNELGARLVAASLARELGPIMEELRAPQ